MITVLRVLKSDKFSGIVTAIKNRKISIAELLLMEIEAEFCEDIYLLDSYTANTIKTAIDICWDKIESIKEEEHEY